MQTLQSEQLTGRVALVTGGSRGIGRAICLALAAKGAIVGVHYRASAAAAEEVVTQIVQQSGKAAALQADLAEPGEGDRLVKEAADRLGPIDILVNNAGEMTDSDVASMPDEMWDRTIALNLTASFHCSRACIPSMKMRRWGRLLFISSQAAYTGSANHAHYAAAKAGMLGLAFSLAKELGTSGITVNVIVPGRITTEMVLDRMAGREEEWMRQTPLRRLGQPEEVASAVAYLASEGASYITGAALHVNGGLVMG